MNPHFLHSHGEEDGFRGHRGHAHHRGRHARRSGADDAAASLHHHHHAHGHGHRRHGMGPGPRGFDDERGPFGGGFGGGPFGGGPFGGGRGGGRKRRMFDQGELQVLLLALIAEAPRHGYDLIRAIETLSGGAYAPSPGVVYPALTYMEEAGTITKVADDSARKAYEATAEGHAQVAADADKAEELKARLAALAQERDRLDPAPIRRAMHNLKHALHDRLSAPATSRATLLEIAEAIDEATRKIERIEP